MPPFRAALPRRMQAPRPLADLVAPCLGPVLARQGFGEADVLLRWDDIVGADLAERCRPVKLQWRRRGAAADPDVPTEPATLVVRVEGAFALMLQHLAPVVLERVNGYLGWRCVGRLVLKQGPLVALPIRPAKPRRNEGRGRTRAAGLTAGVDHPGLREALIAFGSKVLAPRETD